MQKTQVTVDCVCGKRLTKTVYGTAPTTIRCPRCKSTYKVS